jgi:hypothetical protein
LCMGHKNIEVPSDNVGAWRGFFEPSTATLEVECNAWILSELRRA